MRVCGDVNTGLIHIGGNSDMTPSNPNIPFGCCHCGCNGKTTIAKFDWPLRGHIKGLPKRFIKGHEHIIRPVVEDAAPFKIDGIPCRLIPLTRDQFAIVDAADYEWLMQWKWLAQKDTKNGVYYAVRAERDDSKLRKQRAVKMHRVILELKHGDPLKSDHRNGVTLDNRRNNLRRATNAQNVSNTCKTHNKFGHKGVTLRPRGVYRVRIGVNNRRIHVGDYPTLELAVAAYRNAALQHHGEFARFA